MAKANIDALPRSRKEAKAVGSKHYFTGKECSKGHIDRRITSTGHCQECAAEYSAKDRLANREKHLKASRDWRIRNPEKQIASTLAWRAANQERYLGAARKNATAWRKANPDKARENSGITQRARRARKIDAGGSHTAIDISAIRKAQKDRCGYCRVKLKGGGHVDHIKALSKGGSNSRSNLQLLCGPCNQSKSARDPILFAQSLGKLL